MRLLDGLGFRESMGKPFDVTACTNVEQVVGCGIRWGRTFKPAPLVAADFPTENADCDDAVAPVFQFPSFRSGIGGGVTDSAVMKFTSVQKCSLFHEHALLTVPVF